MVSLPLSRDMALQKETNKFSRVPIIIVHQFILTQDFIDHSNQAYFSFCISKTKVIDS
jgi:hypothetical protein